MEAVAAHLVPLAPLRGHGIRVGLRWQGPVERGVEDRDLRHVGEGLAGAEDALEVRGVVQRRERASSRIAATTSSSTTHRLGEPGAAVDDPVPDGEQSTSQGRARARAAPPAPGRGPRRATGCRPRASRSVSPASWCRCAAPPIFSTMPTAAVLPVSASSTWYFSEDDPALTTRTCAAGPPAAAPPALRPAALTGPAWIAVMAMVLTMSRTSAPRDRSLTGRLRPWRTGPMATADALRWTAL